MRRSALALAAGAMTLGAAGPAQAGDLRVSKVNDLSCGAPGDYHAIQAAVTAANPGDTVKVCPGLYDERVTVPAGKDGLKLVSVKSWQAAVRFPSSLPPSGTPNAVVRIQSRNVLLQGFTIEGPWTDATGCVDALSRHYGVRVDSGGSGRITANHITVIQDANNANRGCQDGIAIQVGRMAEATTGSAEIDHNVIDKYQKNGPTVDNAGSTAKIHDNTIDGGGDSPNIAKNGVQISRGATATVNANKVFNNSYTGTAVPPPSDGMPDNDATGVLVFSTTGGVTVSGNTLYLNDLGVELATTTGTLVKSNTTNSNVYDGLRALDDATSNRFEGNKSSSNGSHDCHDDSTGTGTAGTANTWKDNQGVTQSRPGLCKSP